MGAVGDRHLVTVPQGVVGDRLPWVGKDKGGGVHAPAGYEGVFPRLCTGHNMYCRLHLVD